MFPRRMVLFPAGLLIASFLMLVPERAGAYNADSRVHLEAGFEVLNRDIEFDESVFAGLPFPGGTSSAQSLRLLAKLSIRLIGPLEIYAIGGGADLELDDEVGFNSDFSGIYGGGAHLILYTEDRGEMPFQVFTDYRFLRFEVHDRIFFLPSDDAGAPFPAGNPGEIVNEEIQWAEHQVKFGVRAKHDQWEPYGGIRFSFIQGKDHIPSRFGDVNIDFKQSDTFGVFVGTAFYLHPSERAAVFIEGSMLDQYSLAGGFRAGF